MVLSISSIGRVSFPARIAYRMPAPRGRQQKADISGIQWTSRRYGGYPGRLPSPSPVSRPGLVLGRGAPGWQDMFRRFPRVVHASRGTCARFPLAPIACPCPHQPLPTGRAAANRVYLRYLVRPHPRRLLLPRPSHPRTGHPRRLLLPRPRHARTGHARTGHRGGLRIRVLAR